MTMGVALNHVGAWMLAVTGGASVFMSTANAAALLPSLPLVFWTLTAAMLQCGAFSMPRVASTGAVLEIFQEEQRTAPKHDPGGAQHALRCKESRISFRHINRKQECHRRLWHTER